MLGLNNIPIVTKNLLLLNILMFVLTFFFQQNGVDLGSMLGAHYFNSPLFEPYQIVTYCFMHGDIFHIFFNMFALVTFGGFLERLWGPKRFFVLYFAAAIGALVLYNAIGMIEIANLKKELTAYGIDLPMLNDLIKTGRIQVVEDPQLHALLDHYYAKCFTPMVGASGAIFGIAAAFAILFPNTELMLMFIPVPIKAKFLIGGYFIYEVYRSIYQVAGDNVAHLAHVGGAIVGAILVLIWRRNSTHFY